MAKLQKYGGILAIIALLVASLSIFVKSTTVVEKAVQMYGGTSPEISSPYIKVNGVSEWFWSGTMKTATTTVCAIQSPAATSTLVTGSAVFDVSSTTATTVTLAKAATAFATTTSLGSASVSANAKASVVSLRTAAGGDGLAETFGPSQWFVVGMAGGVGTFSPTGHCNAVFREI